jgi:hypothetical protein
LRVNSSRSKFLALVDSYSVRWSFLLPEHLSRLLT